MMMLTLSYSVMTKELGQSTMMSLPLLSHKTHSRIKQFGMQVTMARVEAMMVVIVEVEAMTAVVVMVAEATVVVVATAAAVAVVTEQALSIL
jgi:hypothetical protein